MRCGICWAKCKSAPHPRQPHQHHTTQFFYRPDALPAAQLMTTKSSKVEPGENYFAMHEALAKMLAECSSKDEAAVSIDNSYFGSVDQQ